MLFFRVFFKKKNVLNFTKVKHIIEFEAAGFKSAYTKSKKMLKGRNLKIVMIAEIPALSDLPKSL